MSAENVDDLFKNKLNNRPVAPNDDVWERLQARMQPPVQQQEKKPVMWYYSAAAAVTLTLGVGFWTINQETNPLQPEGSVAAVQPAMPVPSLDTEQENAVALKKEMNAQATDQTPRASTKQEGTVAQTIPANRQTTVAYPSTTTTTNRKKTSEEQKNDLPVNKESTGLMAAQIPSSNAAPAKAVQEAPLEIIIKLDNQQGQTVAFVTPEPIEEPTEEQGSRRILKGILKQVKNIRDGEKIDLSDLRTKHTYALETRIGNKTISKSISL